MDCSDHFQDEWKLTEKKLLPIGKKFENLPDGKEELLAVLQEAESVLRTMYQIPPNSTQEALLPIKKALIHDKLFRNTDTNIKLQVASLINELTRATAPFPPYPDHLMKECFKLFLVAFKYLHGESEKAYIIALRILKTMEFVRTIEILMDIEDSEPLVGEMFRHFFVTIRSNPYPLMIQCMEKVMNIVIENSEEFSMDILMPLLASVEINNKDIAPASWKLGVVILTKNATKLQSWLKEANKDMQLAVDDYDQIVSSLLYRSNNAEIAVPNDAIEADPDEILKDGENSLNEVKHRQGNVSDCDNFLETLSCSEQMVQLRANDSTSNIEVVNGAQNLESSNSEVVNGAQNLQSKTATGSIRKKRTIKRHSLISPDEGYEHPLAAVGKFCHQMLSDINSGKKKDTGSQLKLGKPKTMSDSSRKGLDSVLKASGLKKSISKKKYKVQHLEPSSKSRDIPDSKSKGELNNVSKKTVKNVIAGSNGISLTKGSVQKRKRIQDDTQRGNDDLSREEHSVRQEIKDRMIIEKDGSRDAAMKMVGSEMSSPVKNKLSKSSAPEKEKKSTKLSGEHLVKTSAPEKEKKSKKLSGEELVKNSAPEKEKKSKKLSGEELVKSSAPEKEKKPKKLSGEELVKTSAPEKEKKSKKLSGKELVKSSAPEKGYEIQKFKKLSGEELIKSSAPEKEKGYEIQKSKKLYGEELVKSSAPEKEKGYEIQKSKKLSGEELVKTSAPGKEKGYEIQKSKKLSGEELFKTSAPGKEKGYEIQKSKKLSGEELVKTSAPGKEKGYEIQKSKKLSGEELVKTSAPGKEKGYEIPKSKKLSGEELVKTSAPGKEKGYEIQKSKKLSGEEWVKTSAPGKEKKSKKLSGEELVKSSTTEKEKGYEIQKSKKLSGEELVNMRIKVWWPMDKTFYTGTVHSYDPLTKKHKILYDDDEEEILNLKTEKWEPFHEAYLLMAKPFKKPEPDRRPSPPKELVKSKFEIHNQGKVGKSATYPVDVIDVPDSESDRSPEEDISDRPAKKARKQLLSFMEHRNATSEDERSG